MSGQRIAKKQQTFAVMVPPELSIHYDALRAKLIAKEPQKTENVSPPDLEVKQITYVWVPLYMDNYGGNELYVWAPSDLGKAGILAELLRVYEETAGG